MKVLLSTGLGRLHFAELADALVQNEIVPSVVNGWVPASFLKPLVDYFGQAIGRRQLYQRLTVRRRFDDLGCQSFGLFLPEFYERVALSLQKYGLYSESCYRTHPWELFGFLSRRALSGDIFHVRSGAGQGGAIDLAKKRGMKVVADHSIAHPATMQAYLAQHYKEEGIPFPFSPDDPFWMMILRDCAAADVIVVNSDFVKKSFVENGFEADQIEVAYWGVREDFFALKTDYQLKSDGVIRLLFTGSFCLRKGASIIMEALSGLLNRGVRFQLDVLGPNPDGGKLLAHYPELVDHVHFRGALLQDELIGYLKESDLYVFPSYAEGCARSAMEALAAGLPVVCTEETGVPVEHERSGYLVARGDVSALEEGIARLGEDGQLRQAIGQRAMEQMRQEYTWAHYGARLKKLYSRLLA